MEDSELDEHLLTVFDPSKDHVLGVYGNDIHVTNGECIFIIPREEYLRVWNNWLDGKRSYCELWKEYCGVMGYTFPQECVKVEDITNGEDGVSFKKISYPTFKVTKFDDHCDFEHG
jgi:hypothetical protein